MSNKRNTDLGLLTELDDVGQAFVNQFAAFGAGFTIGKLFRQVKGFFHGASARAENFAEDPISQVLYQKYVAPAVNMTKKPHPRQVEAAFAHLASGVDFIENVFDAYVVSLQRLVDAASRNPDFRISDQQWSPGETKGVLGSGLVAFLGTDMRSYDHFPEPYMMQDEIMPIAGATLIGGALFMIARSYPQILANADLRKAYVDGVSNLVLELQRFQGKTYGIRSATATIRDRMYATDIDMSKFMADANMKSSSGLSQILAFIENVNGEAEAFVDAIEAGELERAREEAAAEEQGEGEETAAEQEDGTLKPMPDDDRYAHIKPIEAPSLSLESYVFEEELLRRVARKIRSQAGEDAQIFITMTEEEVNEYSSLGAGSIAGYSLPLGVSNQDDPDDEMNKHIEKSGWKRLHTSDANIAPDYKGDFSEKGDEFLQNRR